MPAKNIECQLAQGQIGRYLAGANMSAEAISQLEQHIAECDDCTQYVDVKRKTLQEVAQTRHAAIHVPDPFPRSTEPELIEAQERPSSPSTSSHALIQALREKANPLANETVLETTREPKTPRRISWRSLGYSAALGAVLLAMSHFTANPTALFGERVGPSSEPKAPTSREAKKLAPNPPTDGDPFTAEPPAAKPNPTATAANAEPTPAPPTTSTPANSASSATPSSPVEARPIATEPTSNPISSSTPSQPRTTIRSRRIGRGPRQTARPAQSAPRSGNSIRVYDANGKPIG